ncbi:transposase family protein [Streptomyces sp. NPDC051913]|uniref:transposase family protein n=1 Tax=Streptomyces sp. NPDC051913 TaxID=3365676 RepID=UPI0037D8410A
MPATPSPDGPYDLTSLRAESVRRLIRLRDAQRLTHQDIRTVAAAFNVHRHTVRGWMDNADAHNGTYTPKGRRRFTLTPALHDALARWHGNVTAAYREAKADGLLGDPPAASLATFHRAVHRELSPGQRAALAGGERARRRHDVHRLRPHGHRNEVWETDHVEASVFVNVDGRRRKPWITWFVDHATCVITGLAITPHHPSQESVLAAARDAILCGQHHRSFGGVPQKVRVDRGRDFLSNAVDEAFKKFGTELIVLPPYSPHLKGTVESLNAAVKHTLFKGLPGYSHAPASRRDKRGHPLWQLHELLEFETFVQLVLDWVQWWNNDHTLARLHRRTPAQAWADDLTPLDTIAPEALHTYTLRNPGHPLKITSKGVRWKGAYYVGDWMHGYAAAGELVRLRHEANHFHEVHLYDAHTLAYRGCAYRSDELSPREAKRLQGAREREADRYAAKARRARKSATARYAATSTPGPPQRLNRISASQAAAELRELRTPEQEDTGDTRPDLLHRPKPSATGWTQPLPDTKDTP